MHTCITYKYVQNINQNSILLSKYVGVHTLKEKQN